MQQDAEQRRAIELEHRKLALEEKRIAADLARCVLQKNPDWANDADFQDEGHEAGKLFALLLSYIREQRGLDEGDSDAPESAA